jgi:hypothetical protein
MHSLVERYYQEALLAHFKALSFVYVARDEMKKSWRELTRGLGKLQKFN